MSETSAPPVSVVEFLTARYDEEAEDFTLPRPSRTLGGDDYSHGAHREDCACLLVSGIGTRDLDCDCGYPAKVLRDIAAKRAIIALHTPQAPDYGCPTCWEGVEDGGPMAHPCPTLRHLASADSDHRDYREDWRPA